MRIVVDYLAEGKTYEPADQEITDIDGTMRMLYALTGETDFINNIEIFVKETLMQNQAKEYIIGILQTCFQLKEEEADNLYREGYKREHETEIPAFT